LMGLPPVKDLPIFREADHLSFDNDCDQGWFTLMPWNLQLYCLWSKHLCYTRVKHPHSY
jgi:hypothetical protein